MSLLDDVSIVVTPNGYKAGELYAVVPVPSEGSELVTNGDFTQTPLGIGWTVTDTDADNYVVFDGSTARLKFLNTSPLTQLSSSFSFTSGKTYKLVVDIASVTSGGVKVDASGISELFNTVGINTRIVQPTGNFNLAFYRATSNVDLTFNSVSVKEVTRDNVPRIDYTGGGCPHILAEPQRTNLVTYSSDFSNAVWSEASGGSASNPVLTNDYAISPDGTQNATRCLFDMGGGTTISDFSRLRYLNLTATNPVISIYIKSNNATTYQLNLSYGGDSVFLVDAKPNEWTRVDKLTTASGSFDYRLELRGTQTSDDIADVLIWGVQAE